jgi:PAS domain S-box-containing protein
MTLDEPRRFQSGTSAEEAQLHLAAIVESSDDAIISKSLESIITSWNKGAEQIFGYTASEVVGRPITILIPPDRHYEEDQIIAQLKQGNRIEHYETVRMRKDGKEINISLTVSPIKDPSGKIIGASKIARDITDRKRAEQKLQESRDRLNLTLRAAHLGDWSWDAASDLVTLSERGAEIFGISVEQQLTWTEMRGLLHEDEQELARTEVERCIAQRCDYDIEYRVWHQPTTQWRWVAAKGRAVYNGGGIATGMLGIVQDITERKQSREQLDEEREALKTINNLAQTLSGELDVEKLVQALTDAATEITGAQFGSFFYNVQDDRGASYMLYTLSGVPREHFAHFPMPRATDLFGPTFRGEGVIRIDDVKQDSRYGNNSPYYGMPKGHLPVTSYLAVPVISRSGEVIGGLFFGHSKPRVFTERHERIVTGLAGQAAIAMDNARLYEATLRARQEAETANRLKDEFLATVSHELRTPLNAILGWSRMLSSGKLDEPSVARAVETIERNAKAQGQIIEDILDVSRIITGKLRLEVAPVEIAEAIEAAVDALRPTADARGVRLQAVLETKPNLVLGDANRLQQIVWNLLSNAIKFTPKGGRVQVALSRINSHVEIQVSDTGQGISKKFLPYVFERFRQADSSPSRSYGGLGLGLAIVRHLVELHGGNVTADSPGEGEGSTFTVRLPLAIMREGVNQLDPQSAMRLHQAAEKGIPMELGLELAGVRVLAVDDEADARELLTVVLGQCGAEVRTAGSTPEAIDLLKEWRPDVLVSDIGMPGQDGYELIREVRALNTNQGGSIPAIALTAYARSEDRLKALRSGFQTHIAKPVEPAELAAVVASLVRSHGGQETKPRE